MSLAADAASVRARPRAYILRNDAVLKLVSALVFLPSALFALSLKPLPASAVFAGCLGAAAVIVSNRRSVAGDILGEPIDLRRLSLAIGLAAVLLLLGGETHLFFATSDWQIRDAVLADLVRFGLPVTYKVEGTDYLLRAPLGMYMVPAAAGRICGLAASHAALLVQNALILGSTFYLLMTLGRGWAHLAVLVLFSGIAVVGVFVRHAVSEEALHFYLRWSLDAWHPLFQYSGSMVQFFWVPNHALAGWWLATLFLLQKRSNLDVATLGVSVAALGFWSPLAVLPAVPWLAYQAVIAFRSVALSARTWFGLVLATCFVPILLYLVAASGSISHGATVHAPDFAFWYCLFVFVQLPALGFVLSNWRLVPDELRSLLIVNALILLALPFFRFGPHNDLVMRGSTASLTVVAFVFGLVLIELTRAKAYAAMIGWALVALAAPSAALELWRAVATPRYRISDCSLMEASRALDSAALPTNYIAEIASVPSSLIDMTHAAIAPSGRRSCWPDLPSAGRP